MLGSPLNETMLEERELSCGVTAQRHVRQAAQDKTATTRRLREN